MTPHWVAALLGSDAVHALARVLLTCTFWVSGLRKLVGFPAAVKEVTALGLPLPTFVAGLTIFVQLVGSALVIAGGDLVWLGAGALGVFIGSTIFVAHRFWRKGAPDAAINLEFATEHVSVIGGLVLAAILAR